MTNTVIALLSGLIGSILTVIVTKSFELYQKKIEFKSELKRRYFESKLNSLEKASIQYSLITSSYSTLASLFSVMFDDKYYYSKDVYGPLITNAKENLSKAQNVLNDSGLAISIYLDLNLNERKIKELNRNILEVMGVLGNYFLQLEIHYQALEMGTYKDIEDEINKEVDKIEKECLNMSSMFSNLLEDYNKEISAIQSTIRTELRKFEN